jgi:GNAT superfamily N-acetyltransferase
MRIVKDLQLEDFKKKEAIEKRYYGVDYITDAATAYEWYLHWDKTVVCIKEDSEVAGFMNLFPVVSSVYEEIKRGSFNDKFLCKEMIHIPENNGEEHNLFFSCIAIDEKFKGRGVSALLIQEYLEIYNELAESGIKFGEIIADTITEEGTEFVEKLGLKKICTSDHNSIISIRNFKEFLKLQKEDRYSL